MASTYLGGSMDIWSRALSVSDTDSVDGDPNVNQCIVTIESKDLVGRTFLKYGQQFRSCVVEAIVDRETEWKKGQEYMEFICEVPDLKVDEIFIYNEILDHIERDKNDPEKDTKQLNNFHHVAAHQGLIKISKEQSTMY
jgi:hypothetical protein